MKTAMLMQERRTSVDHYVLISVVKFAVWTLRIYIRFGSSQSRYDPDSIQIDFGCSVDTALCLCLSVCLLTFYLLSSQTFYPANPLVLLSLSLSLLPSFSTFSFSLLVLPHFVLPLLLPFPSFSPPSSLLLLPPSPLSLNSGSSDDNPFSVAAAGAIGGVCALYTSPHICQNLF